MIKRTLDIDSYKVKTARGEYIVSLERIENDRNGNGRYKAAIVSLDSTYLQTVTYTFTGHCCGLQGEAEFIVNHHEETYGLKKEA